MYIKNHLVKKCVHLKKHDNLYLYLKQVRDTSRFSAFETVKHPLETAQKFKKKPQDALSGVVLNVSQLSII